ncbi:MAG: hypothetical protein D6820_18340, partial [Lentisphaerae bacterium]
TNWVTWAGVHAKGWIGRSAKPQQKAKTLDNPFPLLGESCERPGGSGPVKAPHFGIFKNHSWFRVNGGKMNYGFTDGSVQTYPYSY